MHDDASKRHDWRDHEGNQGDGGGQMGGHRSRSERDMEARQFGGGQQGGYGGYGGQYGGSRGGDYHQGYGRRDEWRGPSSPEDSYDQPDSGPGRQYGMSGGRYGEGRGVSDYGSRGSAGRYGSGSGYSDYGRGRGDYDRPEYGSARDSWRERSDFSTGGNYSSNQGRGSHHDPDYHQWRSEQMRQLDSDYHSWRDERYKKFSDDFETWRRNRSNAASGGTSAGGTSTGIGSSSGSSATGSEAAGSTPGSSKSK